MSCGADALKKVGFEAKNQEFETLGGNLSELIDPVWFGDTRDRYGGNGLFASSGIRRKRWRIPHRESDSAELSLADDLVKQGKLTPAVHESGPDSGPPQRQLLTFDMLAFCM